MPTIGGTISKQELENYDGASISLMSFDNNNAQTGSISGKGSIQWSLSWDSTGLTGKITWAEVSKIYPNVNSGETLTIQTEATQAQIASMYQIVEGCATFIVVQA